MATEKQHDRDTLGKRLNTVVGITPTARSISREDLQSWRGMARRYAQVIDRLGQELVRRGYAPPEGDDWGDYIVDRIGREFIAEHLREDAAMLLEDDDGQH